MRHRAYDTGRLELLPHLEPPWRAEVAHAVLHLGLVGLPAARTALDENAPLEAFTVGTSASGATRPVPDATVGLYDYAYGMPATLPQRGVVRFENRGDRLHMAVAFPLRRGTSRAAAVQALLRNRQRRFFGRLVNQRRAAEPLGPVSGGTVNDVEVDFGRRADWVFVCFIGDGERGNPSHFTLGMVKAFTVR
jgi:hypothetical protein